MVDFREKKISKKAELEDLDRISQLPNAIQVYILSFLSMEESARTSLLSRQWRWQWLTATELNLDSSRFIKPQDLGHYYTLDVPILRGRYFKWVNQILQSHRLCVGKAEGLNKLRFEFPLQLDSWYVKQVDEWLSFAFKRRVHSLELDLCNPEIFFSFNSYCFPDSLVAESDSSCLRSLSLSGINVLQEHIDSFLFKFRFLEHLKVCRSSPLSIEFGTSSSALKHLEILDTHVMSVIARNTCLVSLTLSSAENLVLEKNPKLVSVCIYKGVPLRILSSCCLSGLQVLTLNLYYTRNDDEVKVLHWFPRLSELKQLTVIVAPLFD